MQSGVRAGPNTPTSRTVVAPTYPGLAGDPTPRQDLPLSGDPQVVLTPAGASPAAITSLPGLGGALGAVAGRLTAISGAIPGQTVQFATAPVAAPLTVTGAPRVRLTISRVPGQPAPAEAVLFVGTSEVAQDGTRTLLGSSVAPVRVAVPADGSPAAVTVTLPGVVAPVEAGHTLAVAVATTDQGYAGETDPAVWRVGVSGGLSVPLVTGEARTANTVPPVPAIGIGVILVGALVAGLVARLRRRPAAGRARARRAAVARHRSRQDLQGRVQRGQGRVVHGRAGHGAGPARARTGRGRPRSCACSWASSAPRRARSRAFGEEVRPGAPVLARIGAFVEGPGFLPHLSGAENLALYWSATGRPTEESHVAEALEIAGLGASIDRRVGTYSQGMRQRLAIAQAMLGQPDLLVLDEPTNGLDPPQIHAMRDVLRRYAADGRTVLVSSHLLAEVERTCSHVVVMHHGKVVAAGTVEQIIAGGGAATFGVDAPDRAAAILGALTGVHAVRVDGDVVHADLNGTPRAEAVKALVAAGVDVTSAGPRRRLEDAFLQLVGEDLEP